MKKDLRYYRSLPYTRRSQPFRENGDSYWLAWIEEFEGCVAEGKTEQEAFAVLEEVFDDYVAAKHEWESEIPEPNKHRVTGRRSRRKVPSLTVKVHTREFDELLKVTDTPSFTEAAPTTGGALVAA